jgi:hypothetical protein
MYTSIHWIDSERRSRDYDETLERVLAGLRKKHGADEVPYPSYFDVIARMPHPPSHYIHLVYED